jgi:phenylpropionate dioxygenase-like ring-hydroxylating dioxygenase large terminal subunit
MTIHASPLEPGAARSPGVTYQELLESDSRPVPLVLRRESPRYLGSEDVSIDRYISRAWHDREVEKLWKRAWQFACREEDIPNAGDYYVYEITRLSFIVMRQADGSIKAFPNACLHRGRRLKDFNGSCSEIRCAFHGFAWTNDGALADVPARWDFPHVNDEDFHLYECQIGRWAGFIFINPDPTAEPFDQFVSEVAEDFADWDLASFYKSVHVAKVIDANWKIVQEAFCEAYHVNGTHPIVMPYLGDTNSQVDIWENSSRVITPGGTPSPLLSWTPTEDDMLAAMLDLREGQVSPISIPEGSTMRAVAADMARKRWAAIDPERANRMSDAELMDSLDYTLFPNFHPWGAYNRIVYRFRPNGDNHRQAIMECIFLEPFKGERPPPAQIHWLTPEERFSAAPELGMLGKVFDGDLYNMPNVQIGLEATFKPGVTLGNYQESKVRWLHQKLDAMLNEPDVKA